MATVVRGTSPDVAVYAAAFNALKLQIGAGATPHLDAGEYFTAANAAANASSLATSLTLVNQLRAVSLLHRADTLIHKAVDSATITAPAATDLATAITLANELKSDYATHIASTSIHFNADVTNVITAANASDQGTLNTLLNDIKTQYLAHFLDAPTNTAAMLRVVSA